MGECPLIYVTVLNWNGEKDLKYCLPGIINTDYPNFHIVLVDNNSWDDSLSFVKSNFPQVTIIRNSKNLRWAGGNNVGIRYAINKGAEYVVLLNNDVKVDSRWLMEAVKVAGSDQRIGIIGFKVFGEFRKESEEKFREAQLLPLCVSVEPTYFIGGCCLFIKAELFKDIGLIDEAYSMFGEESDFEARAMKAGYKMVKINIPMWHFGEASSSKGREATWRSWLSIRNSIRFHLKNTDLRYLPIAMARLFNIICNPFFKLDQSRYYHKRLRPFNAFVAFFFLIAAIFWNILFLPKTLKSRLLDVKKSRDTMKKWVTMRMDSH